MQFINVSSRLRFKLNFGCKNHFVSKTFKFELKFLIKVLYWYIETCKCMFDQWCIQKGIRKL